MVEKKKKGAITNDGLARLMTNGFADVRGELAASVDELAQSTAKGFADVHKDINVVRRELVEFKDDVKLEFDGVKARLTHIDNRLDIMADNHGARLKRIEKNLSLPVLP